MVCGGTTLPAGGHGRLNTGEILANRPFISQLLSLQVPFQAELKPRRLLGFILHAMHRIGMVCGGTTLPSGGQVGSTLGKYWPIGHLFLNC